jgi:SAM-dependent methyltransferase
MTHQSTVTFDQYAERYEEALAEGLSLSGESAEHFAKERVKWLADRINDLSVKPRSVLDYGCGTGASAPLLAKRLKAQTVIGLDPSPKLVERARQSYGNRSTYFAVIDQYAPGQDIDLVFCNGVFHHIPVHERVSAVQYIFHLLRPGGLFALWENNPWNPGTRYVMSRIPFDRDAVTLTPPEGRGLLKTAGFQVIRTDFLFIFPRALRALRWMEPFLAKFPVGAQYLVLGRKPG